MRIRQWFPTSLAFIISIEHLTLSAPNQPAPSDNVHKNANKLLLPLSGRLSNAARCELGSPPPTNTTHPLHIDHTTWPITPSLSLAITICNWQPSPATILSTLSAAATKAGKKAATALLERKFQQRSDNKYNTLYFEISPGYIYRKLTWGDVAEVLGENGLVKFYETTGYWNTVYFDVIHKERGELGNGAVRRWWHLEPPMGGNSSVLES